MSARLLPRARRVAGAALLALAAAACTSHPPGASRTGTHPSTALPGTTSPTTSRSPASPPARRAAASPSPSPAWEQPLPGRSSGYLQPGSDPTVLPADLLIADKLNNRLVIVDAHGRIRWQFPRPGDLPVGQSFRIPDDAFFTPNGRDIVATEEDDFVIRVIDVATHKIVYQYGKPGVHGAGPDRLWNPDDAVRLPDGTILTADIKNQRILLIGNGQHTVLQQWGEPGHGYHHPPTRYGAPNGVFPTAGDAS